MASTPGLKHGLYWWEARAITTAPALSPCKSTLSTKCHYLEGAFKDKKKKLSYLDHGNAGSETSTWLTYYLIEKERNVGLNSKMRKKTTFSPLAQSFIAASKDLHVLLYTSLNFKNDISLKYNNNYSTLLKHYSTITGENRENHKFTVYMLC